MIDRDKVINGLRHCLHYNGSCLDCPYDGPNCQNDVLDDTISMLKELEAVEPKTVSEELKQKMWNALYAEEDKLEKKYAGTKEHNSWFFIYRPWLQAGFDLAIKAIADWEGR